MFWKAPVLEKTEGNKDFPFIGKLKVIQGKPLVLFYKKSKQKENRTEGNKGTRAEIKIEFRSFFGSYENRKIWVRNLLTFSSVIIKSIVVKI